MSNKLFATVAAAALIAGIQIRVFERRPKRARARRPARASRWTSPPRARRPANRKPPDKLDEQVADQAQDTTSKQDATSKPGRQGQQEAEQRRRDEPFVAGREVPELLRASEKTPAPVRRPRVTRTPAPARRPKARKAGVPARPPRPTRRPIRARPRRMAARTAPAPTAPRASPIRVARAPARPQPASAGLRPTAEANVNVNITTEQKTASANRAQVRRRPAPCPRRLLGLDQHRDPDTRAASRPADDLVEINPSWRGYRYVIVEEEIIIVNPRTHKIVYVLS